MKTAITIKSCIYRSQFDQSQKHNRCIPKVKTLQVLELIIIKLIRLITKSHFVSIAPIDYLLERSFQRHSQSKYSSQRFRISNRDIWCSAPFQISKHICVNIYKYFQMIIFRLSRHTKNLFRKSFVE